MRLENMSKLIVIEGLDLTGKTTTANRLNFDLNKKYISKYNKGEINKELGSKINLINPNKNELELFYLLLTMTDKQKITSDYLIQDRSYPSILYYSKVKNINIASSIPIEYFKQPSQFISLVCSYDEKCRRYEGRGKNNNEDLKLISSKKHHDECQELYDKIMGRINDQFGNVLTLDTSKLDLKEIIKRIINKI